MPATMRFPPKYGASCSFSKSFNSSLLSTNASTLIKFSQSYFNYLFLNICPDLDKKLKQINRNVDIKFRAQNAKSNKQLALNFDGCLTEVCLISKFSVTGIIQN